MIEVLPLLVVLWALRWFEFVVRRPPGGVVLTGPGTRGCVVRARPPAASTDPGDIVLALSLRTSGVFLTGDARGDRLSVEEVEATLAAYHREAVILHRAEAALAIQLFLVLPAVWITIGIGYSWPYLLLGTLALQTWTVAAFHTTYGRVLGAGAGDRWMATVPLILAPPAATVAHVTLTKKLFRENHPVAVAAVLCDDDEFDTIARAYLRRAMFPLAGDALEKDAAETPGARRDDLRRIIAERLGTDASHLPAPGRRSETARAYCPRCLAEFSERGGNCPDCSGVRLKELDATPEPA